MGKLTPQQQEQVRQTMFARREQQFQKELNTYFAMSPEQKVAYLNQKIQEQEERAKQWEQRRAERQASQQNGAGGSGGPGGDGQATSGGTSGNNAGGPGNWRNATVDQRTAMRQQMLNQTTPIQRAQRMQYMQDMQTQRSAPRIAAPHGTAVLRRPGTLSQKNGEQAPCRNLVSLCFYTTARASPHFLQETQKSTRR